MKVSKEDAEQYLNAFKDLERACVEMLSSPDFLGSQKRGLFGTSYQELEEFGDIKVGDIYIDLKLKIYYPEHPQRWYFQVGNIYWSHNAYLRSISQVQIQFTPLDPEEMSFTEKYIQELESFKKIRYLSGKCGLFREDKCEFVEPSHYNKRKQGIFRVIGVLVEESLILIASDEKPGILGVHPNEIRGVKVK